MVQASRTSKSRNITLALILLLGTFLLIYAPAVRVNGLVVKIYQIPMVVLAYLWLFFRLRQGYLKRQELFVLAAFLMSLSYAAIVVAVNGWRDPEIIEYLAYGILLAIAAEAWVEIYRRTFSDYKYLILRDVFAAGVIHSFVMLLLFFSDSASNIVYNFIVLTEKGADFVDTGTRSPGLTTGGGAALSVVQSATFMCGVFAMSIRTVTRWNVYFLVNYSIGGILIVLSIMVSGRSGVAAMGLFFMIAAGFTISGESLARAVFRNMCLIFMVMLGAGIIVSLLSIPDPFIYSVKWMLEGYFSYIETGDFHMKSLENITKNMYFLPSTDASIIFGTSNLGRSDILPYIPSDVGYVRLIFSVGIVGTLLVMMPYVYLAVHACKQTLRCGAGMLLISLTIVHFAMNFKELFVVLVQGWTFLYFIVAWSVFGREVSTSSRFRGMLL